MSHLLIIRTKKTLYESTGSRLLKNLFKPNSNLVNMVHTKCTKESTIISRISVKKNYGNYGKLQKNFRKITENNNFTTEIYQVPPVPIANQVEPFFFYKILDNLYLYRLHLDVTSLDIFDILSIIVRRLFDVH